MRKKCVKYYANKQNVYFTLRAVSWHQVSNLQNLTTKSSKTLSIANATARNRSGGDQKNVQYEITRNQYENQSRLDLYRIIVSSQKCYTGLQIVF